MKNIAASFFLLQAFVLSAQTNINVSNYGFNNNYDDAEPYIAMNPLNPNYLVAAWMKVTGIPVMSIAVSYSANGGATWSTPAHMPSLHNNFYKADVSIAYNSSGTAYMSYIDYDPQFDSGYVMVSSSTDNGQNWSQPVKVISALERPDLPVDRPWIAVDRSGGPYNGRIYIVSKSAEAGALPHHIWMKYSSDGGLTWSGLQQIDSPATIGAFTNAMGTIDVGPDGNVYVAYLSYDTTQSPFPRLMMVKSANGGTSFTSHVVAYPVSGSQITDTLYQGSYCLKVNPANASNLVFIVTDARNGDPDILAVSSANGGLNWTFVPVRVNDDGMSNGIGQDMCWGDFSPNGTFCAVWRDRRNGGTSSSSNYEIYTAVSTTGGQTFKPNYRISTQSSPVIPIRKGNDFLGVCADYNYLFTNWCDKRTANTEIFTAKDTLGKLVTVTEIYGSPLFGLKLYPNPATRELNFILTCSTDLKTKPKVHIYDMQGRLVRNRSYTGLPVKGDNHLRFIFAEEIEGRMAAGEYILEVVIDGQRAQTMFTKANTD